MILVKKFRLARVAERFVKEREKQRPTLGIIQQSVDSESCHTSNSEVVQVSLMQTCNLSKEA